jgi:RsiW-degrading membrane proteinase PrsW (M82 family)
MAYGPSLETEPAWGQDESLWQLRRPAFWLFVSLFVIGCFVISHRVTPALSVDIGASSLAFVVWMLYAVPFLVLIVLLDLLEPEPVPLLASAFAWGAVVAVSTAIVANTALLSIIVKVGGAEFAREWGPAIAGPSTEEMLKALGLVVVILVAGRQFNTLLDGLVYGAVLGLGFQVCEDFLYTVDRFRSALFSENAASLIPDMLLLRGLGLGLWSHAVYTAIVGVGIAYYKVATKRSLSRRVLVPAALFATAWLLHFLWNTPWWSEVDPGSLGIDDLPIFLVKGLPALFLVLALWQMAHRREVVWFEAALRDESADVTPEELTSLKTMRGRRQAVRVERRRRGPRAGRLRRQLQRAQVRLAVAVARTQDTTDAGVESARADVRAARRILSLGFADIPGDSSSSR